ncbi:MAG: Trm112 family protein [Acidimicrobiia bacterium]|nr:Trm112 family protein [Acidimicrobiia bacterium]
MIDPELARIIRCPADLGDLEEVDGGLRCNDCGRTYPVRDGIPVLLIEEAVEDG